MTQREDGTLSTIIVDDHPIFRLGLRRGLEGTELRVVGEAETAREAIDAWRLTRPRVVLLDLGLPDGDGFTVCRKLRQLSAETIVVILSSYDDERTIRACRSAGARCHFAKETPLRTIVETVVWLAGASDRLHFPTGNRSILTERELDVLEGLALGLQQPVIASNLGIAVETVKSYVRSAYDKLGVNDRASALEAARAQNLIDAPPPGGYRRPKSTS